MSYIFYYSNHCDHSKKMLQKLSKMDVANSQSVHFVCIDKREIDKNTGKIHVSLDNGEQMILPSTITEVPALMMVTNDFKVIFGDSIYKILDPIQTQIVKKATNGNMEPSSYQSNPYEYFDPPSTPFSSFNGTSGQESSWTDSYGSIISSSINSDEPKINDADLENLQKQRENELKQKQ